MDHNLALGKTTRGSPVVTIILILERLSVVWIEHDVQEISRIFLSPIEHSEAPWLFP